jgi:hypothetical protein
MASTRTVATAATDAVTAARALAAAATPQTRALLVTVTVDVDVGRFVQALTAALPHGVVVGGTTVCQRAATEAGADFSAAALVLDGADVVARAVVIPDASEAGARAAATAVVDALGPAGRRSRFAILHATPGTEETIVRGVVAGLGDVPVVGGSPADHDISGRWVAFAGADTVTSGAALMVCDWPGRLGVTYQSGYLASAKKGTVTAAKGRVITRIDGRPAADVYGDWTGLTLPKGENVLGHTTLRPLGVVRGSAAGMDLHVLVHPERLVDDGGIATFAEVGVGETVVMMESTRPSLIRRGGSVARFAATTAGLKPEDIAGEYIVYCAGCSLALGDDVRAMVAWTAKEVPAPFLMPFTFGEQGRLTRGRLEHGNLMCSSLVLARS